MSTTLRKTATELGHKGHYYFAIPSPVRFPLVMKPGIATPCILTTRDKFQVARVDARAITAKMVNLELFWDKAVMSLFETKAMCIYMGLMPPKDAISAFAISSTPFPALRRLLDILPKILLYRHPQGILALPSIAITPLALVMSFAKLASFCARSFCAMWGGAHSSHLHQYLVWHSKITPYRGLMSSA